MILNAFLKMSKNSQIVFLLMIFLSTGLYGIVPDNFESDLVKMNA
jgi:hypothetical protein